MSSKLFSVTSGKVLEFLDSVKYVSSRVIVESSVFRKGKDSICVCIKLKLKKEGTWQTVNIYVLKILNETDLKILDKYIEFKQDMIQSLYLMS